MMKGFICIFLFLIVCNFGFSQTKEAIDSLQRQLANAKDDTSHIKAQIALCLLYRLGNTDSSLAYGQQALGAAQKIKYVPGQINALGFMSIVTEQRGNLPKSLELGFKALQLGEEHHLETLTGAALDGIGETYIILKDYPAAIIYLHKYIPIEINGLNDEGLAYAYFDLGVAFAGLDQLDSANFYEQKAMETFGKFNYEEPLVYQAMGDIKIKSGKPQEALDYYQKSLQIALKNNEPRASTYAYNKIAALYKNANQRDSAIYYAKKGLAASRIINQKKTILEAAALLSELYEPRDTKLSLQYLKIADAYKDSIFGTGNLQAIQVLVSQEEEHQKQIEEEKDNFQNQIRQYGLLAGFSVVLIIAIILYRNNRHKQKTNKVLEKTLRDLKATQAQLIQSEKMASLGELTAGIAHEIQNPLNFVNNFSDVNKELLEEIKDEIEKGNIEEVKTIANDVIENEQKISHHGRRADAIVKGMLQHSRTSTGKKEPTDINTLCDEYLRLAYHGLRAKDKNFNTTLRTDFDNSIGKINIVPQDIGRVLLNLFNNAFYAVQQKQNLTGFQDLLGLNKYEPTIFVLHKNS
jgi:two-component system, NtrC family, sensor kinase